MLFDKPLGCLHRVLNMIMERSNIINRCFVFERSCRHRSQALALRVYTKGASVMAREKCQFYKGAADRTVNTISVM